MSKNQIQAINTEINGSEIDLVEALKKGYLILRTLFLRPPQSPQELSDKIQMSTSQISRIVKDLENQNLVEREKVPQRRGRPILKIFLTIKGEKIIQSIIDGKKSGTLLPINPRPELYLDALKLFRDGNTKVKELAVDEIQIQSRRYKIRVTDEMLNSYEEILKNDENKHYFPIILISLGNILDNSDEDDFVKVEESLGHLLIYHATNKNGSKRTRDAAQKIFFRFLSIEKSSRKLHFKYLSLIESEFSEDNALAGELRKLLIENHPLYKTSLRVDLLKLLHEKGSTLPHLKKVIPQEYSQLR